MHDNVIKWKHYLRYWPFVQGIHRSPMNSPHKGQWLGALIFSLICAWISGWVNTIEAGNLKMPSCSLWRQCNVSVTFVFLWHIHDACHVTCSTFLSIDNHMKYPMLSMYDRFGQSSGMLVRVHQFKVSNIIKKTSKYFNPSSIVKSLFNKTQIYFGRIS